MALDHQPTNQPKDNTMEKYSIQSAQPQSGFIVTGPDGTPHLFSKLWLALAFIEKKLK